MLEFKQASQSIFGLRNYYTEIAALKFVNKVGTKIYVNGVLEFKQAARLIFGLKNNFYFAVW